MNHYAYIITFENGMKYVGARSTKLNPELDTTYLGSGRSLPPSRTRFNTSKTILKTFNTRAELMQFEVDFIIANNCVESPEWYNQRVRTYDRHGEAPHNKGTTCHEYKSRPIFSERYKDNRTAAMLAADEIRREKCKGSNLAKGHKGTTNCAFIPWYYITPLGEYVEVTDKTKEDMAELLGFTPRQLVHRFHYTNQHKVGRTKPAKGWTFGNLPRPTDTVED